MARPTFHPVHGTCCLAVLLLACGGSGYQPHEKLSDYHLVSIQAGQVVFASDVVPYDLNTPLFSDDATKVRGVWVPAGKQATYDETNAFTFPEGTILIKSFGFPDDMRKMDPLVTWVETRLLVNTSKGWEGYAYLWNAAQTDATLTYAGEVRPTTWIDTDGSTVTARYLVPTFNQCKQCHNNHGDVIPIGPKARELNKTFAYATGSENELAHWTRLGILAGAPDASLAPKLPVWNDPTTGSVDARARAYLEANCAHCHNAGGTANTTGLFLLASETDPTRFGVCKPPVAAGPATGGFDYDVVPADPDHSILMYRMMSTTPSIMMPQIGRSVVDTQGVALINSWITGLSGNCP
jgi:uncharacterized repeat protein (TIGR03806 family)